MIVMSATILPNEPAGQPLDTAFRPPVPEPRRAPPDLFAFLQSARNNPLTSWTREHFEKPVVLGKGVLGRVMVLNQPEGIRHVLVDNAANYRKDDLQRRVLAPGLGEGLLTAEGENWRLMRRTLAPLFTPRTVTGFIPAMNEAAARLTRRWARRDGRVIDMAQEMTRVTLDVLERTIFTHGLARDPDALGRAITRFFEAIGPIDPLDVFGMPGWIPRVGRLRARPAMAFFDRVVSELVDGRKALIDRGEEPPRDLLTLLLMARDPETGQGLDDLTVRANIVTFIGAGHETTANALTWTLYLLSQSPSVRERVEAEIEAVIGTGDVTPEALERLVVTRACLDEAMRLYPPVPFMSRQSLAEDRIAGFRVPRGTLVTIAPYVLHRHRTLWDDPDTFDPRRFMPDRRGAIDRFAYLPFGAGPRVCIGAAFSIQEALIVLAHTLRAARMTLAPEARVAPVHRVTLRPADGLPMTIGLRAQP
jgi:cytochrome P450